MSPTHMIPDPPRPSIDDLKAARDELATLLKGLDYARSVPGPHGDMSEGYLRGLQAALQVLNNRIAARDGG